MKKNLTLRIAAALCILVLLTTGIVSGTFAKYVSSGSSSDTARVAKWGVEVTATSNSLFKTTYTTDDTTKSSSITNSVNSSNTDKLVAPGTKGELTAVTITGTPEVAVEVTFNATLTLTGWEYTTVEGGETVTHKYMPLVITVTDGEGATEYKVGTSSGEYATVSDLITAVQNKINGTKYAFAPNTNLNTAAHTMAISWAWAFSTDAATDAKDTALGNLATAPTISLAVTTTVTQID